MKRQREMLKIDTEGRGEKRGEERRVEKKKKKREKREGVTEER